MEVELSSEQVQLQDGVQRLLHDSYGFEQRQKYARTAPGWSSEVWRQYGEMGLHAIAIPSEFGGLDGGAAELLPVLQAMGKALVLEPFIPSSVLGACALAAGTGKALKDQLLESVATGEHRLAFAHEEPPLSLFDAAVHAQRSDGRWKLTGKKVSVLQARDANSLVVSARAAAGEHGIGLFLVAADAPGLQRHDYLLLDQRSASDISLDGVAATEIAAPSPQATHAIRRTLAFGTAALVAEAAGAARAALEATTSYLATRRQFGRALSEFQALRHRAADMLVSVETVEAMAFLAAIAVDQPESMHEAERDLASAKLLAGRHGRWVCEQAIQLHGAIGMTDEYVVGHYLQRLAVIDALLGNEDVQLDRLAHIARGEKEPIHG
jgi:alkylation response protein AidB-like acyl-CoA dehydrogenase